MALNSLGYSVLVKTKNCNDDANYDIKSEYKRFLSKYIKENNIKYLIDLHGMSKKRDVLISLGTCFGANSDKSLELTNRFIKIANGNGINAEEIRIDFPFFASKRTVSSTINRRNKIETLQIEINSKVFESKDLTISLIKTLNEFANMVSKVKDFKIANLKLNQIYNNEHIFSDGVSENVFEINNQNSDILLASPHSCSMVKEGKECYKETFSGAVAKYLGDNLQLSTCLKARSTDYDSTSEYLNTIYNFTNGQKIKFIIEFHIMNKKRYEDITILTNQGFSINSNYEVVSMFLKTLILNRFSKVSLDYPFNPFNYNSSVANIFKQTKIPSLQFIINQRIFNNKRYVKRLLNSLNEVIFKLNYLL